MPGNAGKGRPRGSRNKRTAEFLEFAGGGESPAAFGLRIMHDETASLEQRLHAARIAAPYVHSRPVAPARSVSLELPEADTAEGVCKASAAVLDAVARGKVSPGAGRDLVAMLDVQRKSLELVEIERRLAELERAKAEQTNI